MKILSIHDGHNATACYLRDGDIISMVSEERFTNKKNQGGYPQCAIKWILDEHSLSMNDFDIIAFPHLLAPFDYSRVYGGKFDTPKRAIFMFLNSFVPKSLIGSNKLVKPYIRLFSRDRVSKLKSYQKEGGFSFDKVSQIEHHTAHGYAALYGSGFTKEHDKVLVFTCDDSGDGLSSKISVWGKNKGFTNIQETQTFHSIGDVYSRVTQYMGMKPGEHEYKIMGMAPYVYNEYSERAFRKFLDYIWFDETNGRMIKKKSYGYKLLMQLNRDFQGERFDNICAGLQRMFEHVIIKWIRYWAKKTGIRQAVFGGGSFMNVKANMLIADLDEFDRVFFCPSCGDESTAMGAAYFVAEQNGVADIMPLKSLYLGPSFDNNYIENALGRNRDKLEWDKFPDIEKKTAELLADGKIVARFRGPSEWGARALGGRSILCRADNPKIIHRLNKAVKMRDFWMPFASSILSEDTNKYLYNTKNISGPFMVLTYRTKKPAREELLAGLHPFDLTCRAQFVYEDKNPYYHKLLTYFKELTGFSGLLNTSFNLHGYPIVGTPEQALDTLLKSNVDYLVLEDFLVKPKTGAQPAIDI